MKNQTKGKKTQSFVDQNPVEAVTNIGRGVRDSVVDDLFKGGVKEAWEKILGAEDLEDQSSGELEEGKEISLKKKKRPEKREGFREPGIDYRREIIDAEKISVRENQKVIQSQIQEILVELKKLSQTSAEIAMEFKEITIEQRIENPGEYHISFFQWMLSLVKAARIKIEDSGAWLKVMRSKKAQRNYWAMFKKHGTTFGLSNERVVATQTG